ncbi:apolipoprotein N-acyltransferase [Haloferula luteola]|uniref:Apolipoprotein N-acyltransferase n=1 Tax=Haloferula luteola TaxID=595692 RepID=A0A840VCT9_9BACT|nr:nitrilase-related carbon-nitrogen hydrolase [Haloferula luteola]MBB5353344.1 apolipoprotein N-acyltransferase [Haloferula luteola]
MQPIRWTFPVRLMLVTISAGLGILSFPPVGLSACSLIFLLPFLIALRGASPQQSIGLGALMGFSLYLGTLNWMVTIFGGFALFLHAVLTLFPMLFTGLWATLALPNRAWAPWIAATLWTGFEYYRCEWSPLRFAWITPGTGLPPGYLTPLLGVYGITFLIAAACAAIAFSPRQRLLGVILLGSIALCTWLPKPSTPNPTLKVAAIQSEEMSTFALLHRSKDLPPVDAIVWPEYATTTDLRQNTALRIELQKLLDLKSAQVLVLGGRADRENGTWENTAFTLGRDTLLGTHVKNRPVHFFDDGQPGTQAPAISTPLGQIATPICFDNDGDAVVRRAVANGAEFLLIPSMDAESWTARQHRQHAALFRHRAAENARWLVVAASSGLTQVVDPWGRRVDSLPLFEPGNLVAEIAPSRRRTPYQLGGWLIGPLCCVFTAATLVFAVYQSRRNLSSPTAPAEGPTG